MGIFLALLAWWLFPVAVVGGWWCLNAWFFPGIGNQNGVELWVYNCIEHGMGLWVWVLIWAFVGAAFAFVMGSDTRDSGEQAAGAIFGVIQSLAFVLAVVLLITFNVNMDKQEAKYYASSVTFYVQDTAHLPDSLHLLSNDGAHHNDRGCDVLYVGKFNDAYGCVKKGDLPADAWVPRIGSNDTAITALKSSSAVMSGVGLDDQTVVYLNGSKSGVWSGVLDGSGIQVPLGGVTEWTGHGVAKVCEFSGDYAINRAFSGSKMNSLTNLFAERFPMLSYQMDDVWGYCKDNGKGKPQEPIVVIPVTEPIPGPHRTVDSPAGVVTVRGDHGQTMLDWREDLKPGEFPGPVYPASLTVTQRDSMQWAAGRQNKQETSDGGNHFGFQPTSDSDVQTGPTAELLLQDQKTGRLQYVTPMVLRGSNSQLFVAFAISNADEVHHGKLNPISIYVFNDNDNRRVPIKTLVSLANNWLGQTQPWLRANGSTLKEFEPINGDTWRAYLENNGQVQYMLDVQWDGTAQNLAKTVLIQSNGEPVKGAAPVPGAAPAGPPVAGPPGPGGPPVATLGTAYCGQPLDQLSVQQLQECANSIVGALAGRAH